METIIFNDNNLLEEELDEIVVKVRGIIINDNKEILLSKWDNMYLLPGGKVRENENFYVALKREIEEETGIILKDEEIDPFLLVMQYGKDYPKRDNINFYNRVLKTYYYIINTNEKMNTENIKLTNYEVEYDFVTNSVNIDGIEDIITNNSSTNLRNKYFTRELLAVISAFKKEGVK